jgi:phage terminase small subunit
MPRKRSMRLVVRDDMISLGVYKPEFDPIIRIYCQLREQYDILTKRFEESDYSFSEKSPSGTKKAPIVTTLEALRKDILAYAAQLGLTVQGLQKINPSELKPKKKKSGLEAALEGLE